MYGVGAEDAEQHNEYEVKIGGQAQAWPRRQEQRWQHQHGIDGECGSENASDVGGPEEFE